MRSRARRMRALPSGHPALLRVMQIHPGLDVIPTPPACPFLCRLQVCASRIAPTPLRDERIPDLNLLFGRLSPLREAPLEYLLVASALPRPCREFVVANA